MEITKRASEPSTSALVLAQAPDYGYGLLKPVEDSSVCTLSDRLVRKRKPIALHTMCILEIGPETEFSGHEANH